MGCCSQKKGRQIGGDIQQGKSKQELMAEAAEKRFQQQSKRGMNDQTAIDYEMKAQRLQAADDMRTKNGNEPYALRWQK